jgi:hypothetical protein
LEWGVRKCHKIKGLSSFFPEELDLAFFLEQGICKPLKLKTEKPAWWDTASYDPTPLSCSNGAFLFLGNVGLRAEIGARRGPVKLRTFEGEPVRGKLTTKFPVSQDGLPVLLVNDEPFSPVEAEFFIEYATQEELEMLKESGYDLPAWEEHEESDEYLDSESLEDESHEPWIGSISGKRNENALDQELKGVKMGRIESWDDFEPEEKDYFANRHHKPRQETENFGDRPAVLRNLEEAMKELERTRFAQVLSILIEKENFQ